VIKIAIKKNKNNPDNKANENSNNIKQNKLISSEHCEKNCKDVGICEKYKKYVERMKNGKKGYGISCSK